MGALVEVDGALAIAHAFRQRGCLIVLPRASEDVYGGAAALVGRSEAAEQFARERRVAGIEGVAQRIR